MLSYPLAGVEPCSQQLKVKDSNAFSEELSPQEIGLAPPL